MYDYLRGTLNGLTVSKATLDVSGIGFGIFIPLNTHSQLTHKLGEIVLLHTSFVVREDSHRLFGFLEKKEKELFERLSDVSGIGPKTALSMIGHLTISELEIAIFQQDVSTLLKVPGIGKKTAERLIVELKDKKNALKILLENEAKDSHLTPLMEDALSALLHLGYHESVAQKALKKVFDESKKSLTLSEIITLCLRAVQNKI